jgi:hypothetical protein
VSTYAGLCQLWASREGRLPYLARTCLVRGNVRAAGAWSDEENDRSEAEEMQVLLTKQDKSANAVRRFDAALLG